jgi:acyl carrier protein
VVLPYDLAQSIDLARRLLVDAAAEPGAPSAPVPVAAGAVAQPRPESSSPFEAPSGDLEHQVAAIWSELLGIDRIGANDDFFELGGHSLAATRVLARIESTLGVRLALRDVFDSPTVRRLAERVSAASGAAQDEPGRTPHEDREEIEF